ncbi:DUF2126 domain-containing protein [Paraconexibacter algicola]|uniref:Transglutaminase n=1 Tax=Paraconexibacter algicola TaxID=2133960 RepID=A0A2T4UKA9_9ACTN|nr:transglutaminase family protein [Paraconexibacter algicola]PTL59694.1 transglutaminase [Paraconexibacter algicola]
MSVRVAIEHRTVYRFDRPVRLGPHVVRLRPAPHCRTPIDGYALTVGPDPHRVVWQQDPFGNHTARLVHAEPVRELSITVELVADLTTINPFDFYLDEDAARWPFAYREPTATDLGPFLVLEPSPALDAWVAAYGRQERGTIDLLVDLTARIAQEVRYETRLEEGVQTPDETFERAAGSCRDSAWLLVQLLRRLGVAARFASGYLVQLAGTDGDGPAHDSTDLHAWAEAYVPGAGWIGLDATSGLLAGEGHIPLCCTSTPAAAAPVSGTSEAAGTLTFANAVRRLEEDPDVTAPYTPEQWERIDRLGHEVDARLEAGGVALTMGGEPTFVAVDDPDAPEWNIAALGPTKHGRAIELTHRLADAFAPGALLRYGQGKWYPSDPLPRWEIGVHWRHDGVPVWRDRSLQADPTTEGSATAQDAEDFVRGLLPWLGLPVEAAYPAYEDTIDELWREARLPGGDPPELDAPDPTDLRLAASVARAAFIEQLDKRTGDPVGWAVPLHRAPGDEEWSTGRWALRRGRLFLTPGDSPIGLRLPLDALTWRPPEFVPEPSVFAEVAPLPVPADAVPGEPGSAPPTVAAGAPTDTAAPAAADARLVEPPPITTLTAQVRASGHLHVFLPPLTALEHALELLRAIEDTAAGIGVPVVIEGYAPPSDRRAGRFVVTPDPGVIEVNIHPSASWPELCERSRTIVDAARETGLAAEKFALDGTHTGTGGGSHLTVGGATPAESPFLRRPDLLRSLITYWQIHPSLSYVFSGRFVGPTSQAPRIDEARHEALYELEIAFAELERLGEQARENGWETPAWQVDRLLRNILTDLTGNTHRAEFCIDKLHNPALESGRIGVLELRGFEMPPHVDMGLVQALLVRTLIARFAETPFTAPLRRWGTELHDRFLLPWWAAEDLRAVAADLRDSGYAFDDDWLDPFLHFRFPRLGEVTLDGTRIELRRAIEPWNVLGEEATTSGTARMVDSSLERLQVRVDHLDPDRHLVTCNGHALPLHPTAVPGVQVAGVRYRAWSLWSALHPTIGVHAPLELELVDRRTRRSLGGCAYHVTEPDGRAYGGVPRGAKEAEARRASRFVPGGRPGTIVDALDPDWDADYPRTLDLRRKPVRPRS